MGQPIAASSDDTCWPYKCFNLTKPTILWTTFSDKWVFEMPVLKKLGEVKVEKTL